MTTTLRPRRRFTLSRAPRPDDGLFDASGAATAADLLSLAVFPPHEALRRLGSGESGLSEFEVMARLREHGINQLPAAGAPTWQARLLASVRSPFGLRLHHARRFDRLLASLKVLTAPRVAVLCPPGAAAGTAATPSPGTATHGCWSPATSSCSAPGT